MTQQLKEQAQFWQQRGRDDNAADIWRKLLNVDPSNVDALMALISLEAKAGNPEQAKTYFAKLRGTQATSAQLRNAEQAMRGGKSDGAGQLDNARKLAQQGDADAAVDAFKQMGDPSKLKGEAAFEYLQVLAGTNAGYAEARKGLEKLSRDNPGNTKYALAHAKVLTYREPSRPEGMSLLENLSHKPDVGKQATESWRQALSWMGLKPENAKYFRTYLDKHPDDKLIQDRLASLSKPVRAEPVKAELVKAEPAGAVPRPAKEAKPPAAPRVVENPIEKSRVAGFNALEANDMETATTEFQSLMKTYPKNPIGYGGMGLVKMREEEFIDARGFLQKAVDLSPGQSKDQWRKAYEDASYWAIVAEARSAFEDGDSAKGIGFLRKAIELNGTEPSGILQLADALQAENDLTGAEANYRRVLNADKENLRALDGLIGVLVLQKRLADLEALTPYMLPRHMAIVANLKSEELANKAKAAETAGDLNTAQQAYEDAIMIKPDNAWLRMALARLYLKRDMPGQARALVDALANVENADPEALYVSALLSEMQQYWWEAMQTLERIPPASRKKEMADMQKRLWVRVQIDRITVLNRKGNRDAARNILASVEPVAGNDPEFTGTMANLYIQLGDNERGFAMIRQAVQNTAKPSAGLLLQFASTLMQSNQEAELEAVMRRVAAMPNLGEEEIRSFGQLQRVLAMRYAERAREAGDFANAYNYIQPLLIANPDDNALLLTLARIYTASGDSASARDIYQKVQQTDPENPEVLQGLVYAAMEARDFANAERYLGVLMDLQPENPRYLSLAGNIARAKGNNSRALDYFKQALALERVQKTEMGVGPNGLRLVDTAPASNAINATSNFKVNPFADGKANTNTNTNTTANAAARGPVLKEVPVSGNTVNPGAVGAGVYNTGIFAPVGKPLTSSSITATPASPTSKTVPSLPALQAVPAAAAPVVPAASVPAYPLPPVPKLQTAPASSPAVSPAVSAPPAKAGGAPADPNSGMTDRYSNGASMLGSYPSQQQTQVAQYVTPGAPYIPPRVSYTAASLPIPQQYASGNAANVGGNAGGASGTSGYSSGSAYASNPAGTGSISAARKLGKPAQSTNVSPEEASLLKEIDAINELNQSQVTVEVAGRSRSGEKGLSALNGVELPIEAQISTLGLGQFGLKIIPVLADAGTLALNDTNIAGQYGRNAILVERAKYAKVPFTTIARQQGLSNVATLDQEAKGVALNLSYELAGVRADIGSSPIGFPVQNVVGGLRWSGSDDGASLGIEIARRSVTDSYLSYAGAKDSLYGLTWGGVTRSGIKLDTSYDGEDGGVYANLGYYGLTGKNVAKNTMAEFGAGAYWRAYKTKDFSFTTGLGLTSFFYQKNLRYFTYGHGGYFSPKSYVSVGV
ncbi:BCSC C-terminal domain-containing protein, partial [Undibacterium sp. CY18W]